MIPFIILFISFFLDGVLTNFLPYTVNNLSLFTPLLTLVSLIVIFPFFRKKETEYLIIAFILGVIYDLFYTDLLFFNGVLFFIIALTNSKFQKNFSINALNILLETIGLIIIYETTTALLLVIYNIVPITIYKIYYKIIHSLLLNGIYVEVLYLILKIIPKKYKKISIN